MKCILLLLVFSTIVLNHCNTQSPTSTAVKEPEVITLSNPKIGVQATLNYTDVNREYAEAVIVNYSGKPIEINTYYVFHFGLQYEDENGEVKDIQGCPPPSVPPANLDDCKKTLQKGEKYNLVYYIIYEMNNCEDMLNFDKPVVKIRASIHYKYPNDRKYNVAYTN